MRTVTATLRNAPKATSTKPYLEVKAFDQHGAAQRLSWTQCYAGTENAGNRHAAAIAGDGSLTRLQVDAATLYRQRVTSPT